MSKIKSSKFLLLCVIFLSIFSITISPSLNFNNSNTNNKTFENMDNTISIKNSFSIGNKPIKIFFNPDNNYVYVLSQDEQTIYIFNSGASVVGNTIPLNTPSSEMTYDSIDKCLYTSNINGNKIDVINTTTNSYVGYINTGNYSDDVGLIFNSNKNLLYVESQSNNDLLSINLTTGFVVGVIPINSGFSYGTMSIDLHSRIYVPNENGSVTIIDSITNTIIKTLTFKGRALTTFYNSWTGFIYISDSNNNIWVYDPISDTIINQISSDSFPVDIIYDAHDDMLFEVNNNTGTLGIINGSTNDLVGTIGIGSDPVSLTYDSNNSQIYIVRFVASTVVQVDIQLLLESLNPSIQNSSSNIFVEVIVIIVLMFIIVTLIGAYLFFKKNQEIKASPDLSLSSIDDLFKKKVLMQYIYGRLTSVLDRIAKLPTEITEKTFLINSPVIKLDPKKEEFENVRLGNQGQVLMKELNGLSLMVLLEFADSFPRTVTLTNIAKSLNKPKSTIKSQVDRLADLNYIHSPSAILTDPDYLDRRYKNFILTKDGRNLLELLKHEIEETGILNKTI